MNKAIEHESLTNGATSSMQKPIKRNAFDFVWRDAPNSRTYDRSKQIQETNPTDESDNVVSTKPNTNPSDGSDSTINTNGADSSNNKPTTEDSQVQVTKKPQMTWTTALSEKLLKAIDDIGPHRAVPTKILEYMNEKNLTREHIASKLQKLRKSLKEGKGKNIDAASRELSGRDVNSNFVSPTYDLRYPYNFNTNLTNNNAPNFHPSHADRLNFMMCNNVYHFPLSQCLTESDFMMMEDQLGYFVGQSNVLMDNNASKSQFGYSVGQSNFGAGQSNFESNNNVHQPQLGYGVGQSNFLNNNNVHQSQLGYGVGQSNFGVGQSNFVSNNNIHQPQLDYGVGQSNFMSNNNVHQSQLGYGVGQSSFVNNNNVHQSQLGYRVGQSNFASNNNVHQSQLGYGVGQSNASTFQLGNGVGQSNFVNNNNVYKSQLSYGGQSSIMMNNNGGQSSFRVTNNGGSHDIIEHMNYKPTYDLSQTGSEKTMRSFGDPNGMLSLKDKNPNLFATSQNSQAPMFGQHGTTNSVLGMNSELTNGYKANNYVGIKLSGKGDLVAPSGVKLDGNGYFDKNFNGMTGNPNTNMGNIKSSTLNFPTTLPSFKDNRTQPHSNFNAQTNGGVPILENANMFNVHHSINESVNNTIHSHSGHHQHQSEIIDDIFQHQSEMSGDNFKFTDDEITALLSSEVNINNDYNDDGALNSTIVNSEFNAINQELGVSDSMEVPLSFDKDWSNDDGFLSWFGDNVN